MKRTAIACAMGCPLILAMAAFVSTFAFERATIAATQGGEKASPKSYEHEHRPGLKVRPVQSLCRGAFDSMKAAPAAGGIHVEGEAKVTDFQVGANYVWMVRILPGRKHSPSDYGSPVFKSVYRTQAFQVAPEQEEVLTFEDLVLPALPAGDYCIELDLVRLTPGATVDDFKDRKHLWSFAIARGSTPCQIL